MSTTLDRIATVVFIVACLGVMGSVAYRQLASARSPEQLNYARGELLEANITKDLGPAPTLIFNLRSTCRFCEMSLPHLQQLLATASARWPALRIVATSVESDVVFRPYLDTSGLAMTSISLESGGSKLSKMVVPSLVVADAQGEVVGSWLGVVSDARAREIGGTLDGLLCPEGCPSAPR